VYREQFAQLIPRGVEASRSLIDWLWPTWPELRLDAAAGHVDLQVPEDWQEPVLLVFTQTAEGQRAIKQKVQLRAGAGNRVLNLPKLAGDQRTVIVLRARRSSGEPLILEHVLGAESKTFGVVPAPAPPALPATEAAPPQPAEEAPADPRHQRGRGRPAPDHDEPGRPEPRLSPRTASPPRPASLTPRASQPRPASLSPRTASQARPASLTPRTASPCARPGQACPRGQQACLRGQQACPRGQQAAPRRSPGAGAGSARPSSSSGAAIRAPRPRAAQKVLPRWKPTSIWWTEACL
jgi:hypothetical protein